MSTDPSGTPDRESSASGPVESTAERIAAEASDVRERIRALVVDAVSGNAGALTDLRRTADSVLAGVARGVKSAGEGKREGVLNEAISGVADGVARSVNATRLALREAEGRGQRFAEEDLKRTVDDLRTIEELFSDTLTRFAARATEEAKAQTDDVRSHAERTAQDAKSDIASAIEAATQHPAKLASEAASTAANTAASVAKQGVGSLFQIASGLLDAASDVAGARPEQDNSPDGQSDKA